VLKGFKKPVTVKVITVPVGQSVEIVHAFDKVTLFTTDESVEEADAVQVVAIVPILHVTGFVPSKNTVSGGKVTLTPEPYESGVEVLTENV